MIVVGIVRVDPGLMVEWGMSSLGQKTGGLDQRRR
jgi:hypothetical protein